MKLLKRKYPAVAETRQKVAGRIALWMAKLQTAFATYMDRKINPLPVKQKRWLLFGFCFLLSLYCLSLLLAPFTTERKKVTIKVEPIQFAKPQQKEKQHSAVFIPKEQYNRIHAFKLYLDSLAESKTGRRLYDSIVGSRPGLMDSLKMIEAYYQIQK